ncbi:MAG: acetate--CoA ligase [Cytophagales bacterium]
MAIRTLEEYHNEYKLSVENPEKYWETKAEQFVWKKRWDKVLDWNFSEPNVKWFLEGKLNITENCLDRHLPEKANKIAIHWEGNDLNEKNISYTYQELYTEVCKAANMLKQMGVHKGDRVCIYIPMVPELLVSVLACARIGAIHSVIFAGFSANSLADRINDAQAKVILTSDGGYRGNKVLDIKSIVDEALTTTSSVEKVIVVQRTNNSVSMKTDRDYWWHDLMATQNIHCEAEPMDSEDPLFILYTSGSTGKPKGVLHTTAGYMVYVHHSFTEIFQVNDSSVYWCTADIGWITGHSYLAYAPLLAGVTQVMFEGIPNYPDSSRFWKTIDKYKVTHFYTAPTAIRSLMAAGEAQFEGTSLESLQVLGSVGEPINEEAWQWYYELVGKSKCPIVDTWWQTETGGILISPLANITPLKPSFATLPLPGVQPVLVDNEGNILEGNNVEGNLCVKFPWPSIIRTTYGDHERCRQTYFGVYKNLYFTGDGCKRDADGYYRILGRVDDVINVSGHRIGTAEVENAINETQGVIESAVVGYPHEIKGQGIYAYVIVESHLQPDEQFKKNVLATVTRIIGPIAKPDMIQFVPGLPKTRSGKIMRRILRKIAEKDISNLGDISTLLDPSVVDTIVKGAFLS